MDGARSLDRLQVGAFFLLPSAPEVRRAHAAPRHRLHVSVGPASTARSSSDATLVFEAASVKPNQSRNCERDGSLAGGRFVMTCAALRELIVFAYPRQDGRLRFETEITGGPSWINADHFDVVAKAPERQDVGIDAGSTGAGAATIADASAIVRIRQMAQALLADRFKLTVHHELRDLAVYELRMDRSDGALGPQLKRVDVDCASQRGSRPFCGGFRTIGPGHIQAYAVSMSLFAQVLEMPVSRNTLDGTGLQGTFDLELLVIDNAGKPTPD